MNKQSFVVPAHKCPQLFVNSSQYHLDLGCKRRNISFSTRSVVKTILFFAFHIQNENNTANQSRPILGPTQLSQILPYKIYLNISGTMSNIYKPKQTCQYKNNNKSLFSTHYIWVQIVNTNKLRLKLCQAQVQLNLC